MQPYGESFLCNLSINIKGTCKYFIDWKSVVLGADYDGNTIQQKGKYNVLFKAKYEQKGTVLSK